MQVLCRKTCWLSSYLDPSLICFSPSTPTFRFRSNTASICFEVFGPCCLSLISVLIFLIYCNRMGFTQTFPRFFYRIQHIYTSVFFLACCVVRKFICANILSYIYLPPFFFTVAYKFTIIPLQSICSS